MKHIALLILLSVFIFSCNNDDCGDEIQSIYEKYDPLIKGAREGNDKIQEDLLILERSETIAELNC